MTIMYALGWTQHSHGSQNIRTAAMIQLLCGNIGVPGGGVNALRGHANVQGLTDMGTLAAAIPGYLAMPIDGEPTLQSHLAKRAFTPLQANQISFWQNYHEVLRQLPEDVLRRQGDAGEQLRLRLVPEARRGLRHPAHLRDHASGQDHRLHLPGLQPDDVGFAQGQERRGPVEAEVPRQHRSDRDRHGPVLGKSRRVQRRRSSQDPDRSVHASVRLVSRRRTARSPTRAGTSSGSGRRQTYLARAGAISISSPSSSCACVPSTRRKAARVREQLLNVSWSYKDPMSPTADEILQEINGKALVDLKNAEGEVTRAAGSQLASFARDARRRLDGRSLLDLHGRVRSDRQPGRSGATTATRPA